MFFMVANVSTGQARPPRDMELHTQVRAFLHTCVLGGGGDGKETSSSDSWFSLSPLNVALCMWWWWWGAFPRDSFHCLTSISSAILLRVLCASYALEFLTFHKPFTIPFSPFVLPGRYWHRPHFPDKETEAYREGSYPSWHSGAVSEPGQEMGLTASLWLSCPVTWMSWPLFLNGWWAWEQVLKLS